MRPLYLKITLSLKGRSLPPLKA